MLVYQRVQLSMDDQNGYPCKWCSNILFCKAPIPFFKKTAAIWVVAEALLGMCCCCWFIGAFHDFYDNQNPYMNSSTSPIITSFGVLVTTTTYMHSTCNHIHIHIVNASKIAGLYVGPQSCWFQPLLCRFPQDQQWVGHRPWSGLRLIHEESSFPDIHGAMIDWSGVWKRENRPLKNHVTW